LHKWCAGRCTPQHPAHEQQHPQHRAQHSASVKTTALSAGSVVLLLRLVLLLYCCLPCSRHRCCWPTRRWAWCRGSALRAGGRRHNTCLHLSVVTVYTHMSLLGQLLPLRSPVGLHTQECSGAEYPPAVARMLLAILEAEQDVDTPLLYVVTMRQLVKLLSATKLLVPQIACGSTEAVLLLPTAEAGLGLSRGLQGCALRSAAAASRLEVRRRRTVWAAHGNNQVQLGSGKPPRTVVIILATFKQLVKVHAAAGVHMHAHACMVGARLARLSTLAYATRHPMHKGAITHCARKSKPMYLLWLPPRA
jgi:hypothetical protein